jgi:hypothetical protein
MGKSWKLKMVIYTFLIDPFSTQNNKPYQKIATMALRAAFVTTFSLFLLQKGHF